VNHIKVNFPDSQEAYECGSGEGMFVIVDDETKAAHDADVSGGTWRGTLDNDSWYWKGLEHGATVTFEMRGDKRPVVPFEWLAARYEINRAFFEGGERKTLYYLDCLDAQLGERYMTLDELRASYYGANDSRELTEKDAIAIAQNMEAILYRCEAEGGEIVESTPIYDPWNCFE